MKSEISGEDKRRIVELEQEIFRLRQEIESFKRMEGKTVSEIRQLEEFKESVVNNRTIGVAILDRKGYHTFVNPAFSSIMGFAQEELIGAPWQTYVIPGQEVLAREMLSRSVSDKVDYLKPAEIDLRHKDGRRISVLSSSRFLYHNEEYTGTMVIFIDITNRKRTENVLSVLYEISRAVSSTGNLNELFHSIHRSLGRIVDVSNFAIAVYDKESDSIHFPYFQDEKRTYYDPISEASTSGSANGNVIRTKKNSYRKRATGKRDVSVLKGPDPGIVSGGLDRCASHCGGRGDRDSVCKELYKR